MAKVTFRLPSKQVQYGYTEVEFDLKTDEGELPSPALIGAKYTEYFAKFVDGELNGVAAAKQEFSDAEAAQMLKDTLGATELSDEEAAKPWNKGADAEDKPWDAGDSSDWDF